MTAITLGSAPSGARRRASPNCLEALGEEDVDLLVRFGAHGYSQGYAAAGRVWSLAPETARERFSGALASRDPTAQVWCDTAPADSLDEVLAILSEVGPGLPPWCASWLARFLPRAGHAAPAVFALLRTVRR